MTPENQEEERLEAVLVRLQRDANEKLVLALIREGERADRAETESAASRVREDELRNVGEFRERLIGIVGHDLRNPLNAILMAAGLLVAGGNLAPTEAQLATRILDAGRRMKRVIVQVLEFTRAHLGGGFVLDRSRTDVGDIARRVAAELRLASGRTIHLDERGDVCGSWDSELLGEALSNVVGNAVEHAAPQTAIRLELAGEGDSVVISVTNEGATIPPDMVAHIFEPFHHGDGAELRAQGNLGLGLYIANAIVHEHGGRIEVDSFAGTTTFAIFLPRE